ncbi:hypothetical protein PRIC2_011378 [Phytophthora ramorum]
MFASMSAQHFIEYVQIHWHKFGFLPHSAVSHGLSSWNYGTRGLSVLHFVRVTESEKRSAVRSNDMSNFSRKDALPRARPAADFTVLMGAVEVLNNVTCQLYGPFVNEIFEAASKFLLELRDGEMPTSEAA